MKISIIGCGWLGLPLAEHLTQKGHILKGSTTNPDKLSQLKAKNIEPYLIHLDPHLKGDHCDSFWKSEAVVINIPPTRGSNSIAQYYTSQMKALTNKLETSPVSFVVFVSSTSVYPKLPGIVSEDDARSGKAGRHTGNALLTAENLLRKNRSFDTTIVRFGGLYGYDRNPANYLAGRTNLPRGKAPVNLIHRDDCINILVRIIEQDVRNETFNAVSDGHPPRKMFYKTAAKTAGVEPPTFQEDENKNYKIVSNKKLKQVLGYQFHHPNPMDS